MAEAKTGDTVNVHYTGKLKDGSIFDSSEEHEPLQFTIGEGKVIPGFEKTVIGMNPGETRTAEVSQDEAYGSYLEELQFSVEKSILPEGMNPEVGQYLQMHQNDGNIFNVKVTDINEKQITLDANHPLAGQDLIFDIQLVEIV